MIGRLMAVHAQEIVFTHVNINTFRRKIQTFIQITVLHTIAAAAIKMTCAAILTGWCTHALRNRNQINTLCRLASGGFHISARLIMTCQTIDILGIREVVISMVEP